MTDQEYLKGLTLLYVEDEDDIFEPGVRLISRYCGTLLTARNGQEGLDVFKAQSPDLIITDIKMPTMDGLTMAEEIKKLSHSVPIVVVTAFEQVDYLMRAIEIGVDKYVSKPVNRTQLLRSLLECAHQLRAERELLESKEWFRQLFNETPDAHTLMYNGVFTDCNSAAERLLRCERHAICGQTPKNFSPEFQPDGRTSEDAAAAYIAEAIGSGRTLFEWLFQRSDGTQFWAEISLSIIVKNGRQLVFSRWSDISMRKLLEQERQQLLDEQKIILENAGVGIALVVKRRRKWANSTFFHVFGYGAEEMENESTQLIYPSQQEYDQLGDEAYAVIATGETVVRHQQLKRRDGTLFTARICGTAIDKDKPHDGSIWIVTDVTVQQALEEKLQQSHDLLHSLSRQIPGMIYQLQLLPDGSSCFPYASNAIEEIFGVTPEQVREDASIINSLIHPEDAESVALSITGSARTLEPWMYEFRVVLPQQGVRWRYGFAQPSKMPDGSVLWHGFINDITDQKTLENQLSASMETANRAEARLQLILKSTDQGIQGIDEKGRFTYSNKAALQILGYTAEELMGKDSHSLIHHSHLDGSPYDPNQCPLYTASLRGLPCRVDSEVLWRSDGTPFYAELSSYPVYENGIPRGAVVTFSDISERRKNEEELLKLSRAVEQSPASIIMTNIRGEIEFVNPRFTELTGYSLEEVVGRHPGFLESGKLDANVYKELQATIVAGNTWHGELISKRKDGTLFWELASVSPVRNAAGEVVHYLSVSEDITHNKKLLEELHVAKERAEAATRAKSTFLSSMSHEIRTPMNGVIGMTSLLFDTELTQEQHDCADTIRRSGENLLDLINDILDFSKIEAGKLELELLELDLCTMMEDTAELLALRAAEKGVELVCTIDPAIPPTLKGDSGRIRQIITNLVGNAIKFTRAGEIIISASLKADSPDSATVLFEVTDSGIGIPADRLEAVFAPFTQAEGSTTRKFGGTGLGLSICKQLTELMGGTIGVTSEYGVGSTFSFTVCLEKMVGTPDSGPVAAGTADDIKGARILIVDDNATSRTLLKTLLERWECSAVTVADAENAREVLRQAASTGTPFHIALIDMKMPGMDGFELGRHIKADSSLASLKMIMMSAYGQARDKTMIEQFGFDGYLSKPIRQSKLHDCIAHLRGTLSKPVKIASQLTELPESHHRKTFRLLLAEDNIINQKVAQKTLHNLGYNVDVVANGLEAVRSLEVFNYDLVLMDCQMPEMDGFEATAVVRDAGSRVLNHQVPIIAMTANAMAEDRENCLRAGMDDYVSKPVKKEVVSEVLNRWLKNR